MSDFEEDISAEDFSASEDEWKPSKHEGLDTSDSDFEKTISSRTSSDKTNQKKRKSIPQTSPSTTKKPRSSKKGSTNTKRNTRSLRSRMFNKYKPLPKTVSQPKLTNNSLIDQLKASEYKKRVCLSSSRSESSDSSINDHLINPKDINLTSNNTKFINDKSDDSKLNEPPNFDCNVGMKLSDSDEDDNEEHKTTKKIMDYGMDKEMPSCSSTNYNFDNLQMIEQYEKAKQHLISYNKKESSTISSSSTNAGITTPNHDSENEIRKLLAIGERSSTSSFMEMPKTSSSSDSLKENDITKKKFSRSALKSGIGMRVRRPSTFMQTPKKSSSSDLLKENDITPKKHLHPVSKSGTEKVQGMGEGSSSTSSIMEMPKTPSSSHSLKQNDNTPTKFVRPAPKSGIGMRVRRPSTFIQMPKTSSSDLLKEITPKEHLHPVSKSGISIRERRPSTFIQMPKTPSSSHLHSESESDWEEVQDDDNELQHKSIMEKYQDGVQITVELPQFNRRDKKKSDDIEASLKRRINRVIKENQIYLHKVSLLCHIAHGIYCNKILNNPQLMSAALKLLPNQSCYPNGRTEIKYFESMIKWYKNIMQLKYDGMYCNFRKRPKLLQSLALQIKFKSAICKKDFVLIFIILLRAMGIQCRLVMNLVTLPIKPSQNDLCSLKQKKSIDNNVNAKKSNKNKKDNKKKLHEIKNKNEDNVDDITDDSDDEDFDDVDDDDIKDEKPNIKQRPQRIKKSSSSALSFSNKKNAVETESKIASTFKNTNTKKIHIEKLKSLNENDEDNKSTNNSQRNSKQSESNKNERKVKLEKLKLHDDKNTNLEKQNENVKNKGNAAKSSSSSSSSLMKSNVKEEKEEDNDFKPSTSKRKSSRNQVKNNEKNSNDDNKNEQLQQKQKQRNKPEQKTKNQGNNKIFIKLMENERVTRSKSRSPLLFDDKTENKNTDNKNDENETRTKKTTKGNNDDEKSSKNKKDSTTNNDHNVVEKTKSISTRSSKSKLNDNNNDNISSSSSSKAKTSSTRSSSSRRQQIKGNKNQLKTDNKNKEISLIPQMDGADDVVKKRNNNKKSSSNNNDNKNTDTTASDKNKKKINLKKLKVSKKHEKDESLSSTDLDSDDEFVPSPPKKIRKLNSLGSKLLERVKRIDRRVLSTDDDDEKNGNGNCSNDEKIRNKKYMDIWIEVFSELEEQWITIDLFKAKVHCVDSIRKTATQPIAYVFAWDNNNALKDVSQRYCPQWNTTTRKLRVEQDWLDEAIINYIGKKTARDIAEDRELFRMHLEKPLPTTISEYKNHPLYALERHLLKFEVIYPPNALTLGFVRGEPVYARECVHVCHSREIWLKSARVVKPGEKPYKIVKARPKWDRMTQSVVKDQPLEIFGYWQTMPYDPPTAENGIVPRNAYGNVELFKKCMLPKKTVHLQLPGLNKICKKLNIDCAPAVIGFDFHQGVCHPMYDGFVICEEFKDIVIDAWNKEREENQRKEEEKYLQRVYGNWKKLIRGMLIKQKLKLKYNF